MIIIFSVVPDGCTLFLSPPTYYHFLHQHCHHQRLQNVLLCVSHCTNFPWPIYGCHWVISINIIMLIIHSHDVHFHHNVSTIQKMRSHVSSFFDYFDYKLLPYHSDIVKVIVIVKTQDVHFHQNVSTIHSALHWLLCHLWEPCRHSAILLIIIVILIVIFIELR